MSAPNVNYHYDYTQQRYFCQKYNHHTKQWQSEWMPAGWHPQQEGQPTTPSQPDSNKRRDSVYTGSSPLSPGSFAAPLTYGSTQAGGANVQQNANPAHMFGQSLFSIPQYPTSSNFVQGSSSTDLSGRPASGYGHNLHPPYTHSFPRGEGQYVKGHYNNALPLSKDNLHYEEIDPSYYVRDKQFFQEGKVFAVILSENAGSTVTSYNSAISEARYKGNYVHTQSRRFVVVRQRREFCYACPIFTYSKRATTKRGVRPEEHGIAYTWGRQPQLIAGETGITKPPIAVVMAPGEPPLQIESRIYYGIHHPIQYNVKVKDIGYVIGENMPTLIGNWKEEDEGESRQAPEVTAAAEEPELQQVVETAEEVEAIDRFAYHPQANISGYHSSRNPHGYHPRYNPYGYHSELSPHCYHPESNPRGYHAQQNPQGHHPQTNPHGYHPQYNPYGYNSAINPFCYHPQYNPQGYHAQQNPHGYHPHTNPHAYHSQANIHGYHANLNPYGYHPQYNAYGWHPQSNPLGYHPKYNLKAYHPTYHPNGVYLQQNDTEAGAAGEGGRDDDDDDNDEDGESSEEEQDDDGVAALTQGFQNTNV